MESNIKNHKYIELKNLYNEILKNIKIQINKIDNNELKEKNSAILNIYLERKNKIIAKFLKIINNRKIKTELGKLYYQNLLDKTLTLKNESKEISNFNQFWANFEHYIYDIDLILNRVKKIPYSHIGISIMGYGLVIIPFYNLLTLAIGAYLLYSSDYRGRINGILMIILLIGYLIIAHMLHL